MKSEKGSVAIIGCGINGMFCAYYLLKSGYEVTIIDRNRDGLTSKNNAGLLTPSLAPAPEMSASDIIKASTVGLGAVYISPSQVLRNIPWFIGALKKRSPDLDATLVNLGRKSVELYNRFFKEEGVDADVIKGVGAFYGDEDEAKRAAEQFNGRFVSGSKISKFGYKNLGGGVIFDNELSINSDKLFYGIRSRIEKAGAKIILGKDAKLNGDGDRITSISAGESEVTADHYIAAGGSWSNDLLIPLGYNPRIIPARGMVMMFGTGGERIISMPSLLEPQGVAIVQHDNNTVRITSFFEFMGTDGSFAEKRREWLFDMIESHVIKYKKMKLNEKRYGFRPCTPDQMPVIGKVTGISNLFIAGGQCRLGVTLAPITGTIITGMIEGKKSKEKSLEYLSPKRFANN